MENIIKDFKGMTRAEILKWAKDKRITIFDCGHIITLHNGYTYYYKDLYFNGDICVLGRI